MEQHIVKRFDEELDELKHNMLEMGRSVRRQLDAVGLVLLKLDRREAGEIEAADVDINRQEKDLDAFIECILSSRQPQAIDLRMLLGYLRMTIDFERMGDEVRNAAKGVRKMSSSLEGQLLTTRDALLTIHAHLLVMTTEALLAVEDCDVEKARADRIYGNDKLMPVVLALGCGIGEEFDISKLRYDKVFIMADADVDGSHICTLMLTFFFRYMRPLIEQGHVYVAQPPLFKVQKGNTIKYAYNDAEMAILSQEMPGAKVNRYKGLGEMNPEQLWETTMNPDNRVIVQITIEDAEKADEAFTILMGDQVEPRRRFIETNAQYAKLDV